jgi:hypothetical protein
MKETELHHPEHGPPPNEAPKAQATTAMLPEDLAKPPGFEEIVVRWAGHRPAAPVASPPPSKERLKPHYPEHRPPPDEELGTQARKALQRKDLNEPPGFEEIAARWAILRPTARDPLAPSPKEQPKPNYPKHCPPLKEEVRPYCPETFTPPKDEVKPFCREPAPSCSGLLAALRGKDLKKLPPFEPLSARTMNPFAKAFVPMAARGMQIVC